MGTLRVMSQRGDDRFMWDVRRAETGDPEAVAAVREAERIFREQREAGVNKVRVETGRAPGRLDQFDLNAEQILMIPRVVGG